MGFGDQLVAGAAAHRAHEYALPPDLPAAQMEKTISSWLFHFLGQVFMAIWLRCTFFMAICLDLWISFSFGKQ